ncbi:MAG: hypothetical protein AAF698_03620, partial [Pseudomonadota bacterium]
LWASGDWGHVEDASDPTTALHDLRLMGSDSEGGTGQVRVESYDAAEPTAVTGPVHLAAVRNLAWGVDLRHAPPVVAQGSVFDGGVILAVTALGRGLVVADATVQGPHLMRERRAGTIEPSGILIGGALDPLSGSGAASLHLSRLSVADIARAVEGGAGTEPVALRIEDCRFARLGTVPVSLGAGTGAVAIRRTVMQDSLAADRFNSGAWLRILPDGAAGYDPLYRPGTQVTVEDCLFLPGQGGAEMAGLVLARDDALGDGSAEADFGYVYSPLTLRRSLILGGVSETERDGLWLSSGEAGDIEDAAVLADGRVPDVEIGWRHGNGFRPLGAGFSATRSVANADGLGAGVSATDRALATSAGYGGVFAGSGAAAFAPRTVEAVSEAFRPQAGSTLDIGPGDTATDTIGPLQKDGAFKGDLSAVPAALPVAFGIASWGADGLVGGIGWGEIPAQPAAPFEIKLSRSDIVAPAGVHVEITGLSEEEILSSDVLWDFGEDYDFDALPIESPVERSARFSRGHVAAHVYQTPGTWVISVEVRDRRGDRRTAQATVTVQDPDVAYAGTLTMAYAADGDFTGAPAGAILTTDFSDIVSAVRDQSAVRRIALKSGSVIPMDSRLEFGSDKMLTRFGEGPRPRLVQGSTTQNAYMRLIRAQRVVIAGIVTETDYDVVNPAPPETHPEALINAIGIFDTNLSMFGTVFDCEFVGPSIGVYLTQRMIVANCIIRDWYDYGVFGELIGGGIIGSHIAQNPNALRNDNAKTRNSGVTQNSADHGPIRNSRFVDSVIAQNSLASWNGWSRAFDGLADQPCIRCNTTLRMQDTNHGGVIQGNYMVGGFTILSHNALNSAVGTRGKGCVIANNVLEATGRTQTFLSNALTPTVIRNNLMVMPQSDPEDVGRTIRV